MLRRRPGDGRGIGSESAQPPFWVIGAPRSGTTFLAEVLNRHPAIFLTNETRVMLLFSRFLNRMVGQRRLLASNRDEILDSLWRRIPGLIEKIYRDLGAQPGQRWGDKYPQYADADVDPEALVTIDRLFPQGQYIHIVRDPRAVVASITEKGWLGFEDSITAWRSFVTHARSFGQGPAQQRFHELRFEELVMDGVDTVKRVFDFLGLPASGAVDEYLRGQERQRTQISYPTGQPGAIGPQAWQGRLDESQVRAVESELGDLMVDFGYEITSPAP